VLKPRKFGEPPNAGELAGHGYSPEHQATEEARLQDLRDRRVPNIRCLVCRHEFYSPVALETVQTIGGSTVDCPACKTHYNERDVECWTQIVWPYPFCPPCKQFFDVLKRTCTVRRFGECDCPRCFGICVCGDEQ